MVTVCLRPYVFSILLLAGRCQCNIAITTNRKTAKPIETDHNVFFTYCTSSNSSNSSSSTDSINNSGSNRSSNKNRNTCPAISFLMTDFVTVTAAVVGAAVVTAAVVDAAAVTAAVVTAAVRIAPPNRHQQL